DEDIAYALRRATRDFGVGRDVGWLEERDLRACAFAESRFHDLVGRSVAACAEGFAAAWREIGESAGLDREARRLVGREVLRRGADALLAPLDYIEAEAADCGWDLERLQRRLDGDMALAMRRIACIPNPGGAPNGRAAHFRIDAAGRTLERRGALQLAPRGRNLDCPAWPAHRGSRGELLVYPVLRHDEGRALAMAWSNIDGMSSDMLLLNESAARGTAYAADLDKTPVPVGGECRICAHDGCQWRREPFVAS
ncbi:MAG: short-chain fatty acyl-CoA regulator family protein, partial [Pseudomonadota bacterium]